MAATKGHHPPTGTTFYTLKGQAGAGFMLSPDDISSLVANSTAQAFHGVEGTPVYCDSNDDDDDDDDRTRQTVRQPDRRAIVLRIICLFLTTSVGPWYHGQHGSHKAVGRAG